jgi:septum formation inhibitor MinC
MGDAGEGLIDADSRIQERMEELARERAERKSAIILDPEAVRELESLRLARTELQRQLDTTTNERRRAQLVQAVADLDARMEGVKATLEPKPQAAEPAKAKAAKAPKSTKK